jgi:hypothetical protein
VICAQRVDLNAPGHICVVVPEIRPMSQGGRAAEFTFFPLQSQAGSRNFCYSCGTSQWWAGPRFRAFGFWFTTETRLSKQGPASIAIEPAPICQESPRILPRATRKELFT